MLMKLTAQDVMTSQVLSVSPQTRVEDAAAHLARNRITGLPVLDESGSIVGMISDLDLIAKHGSLVSDIMTTQVISISPDTDLDEVGHILTGKDTCRLPVIQAGRLVGIITRGDLIRRIAQRWTCSSCGSFERGKTPPAGCTSCGADSTHFTLEDEPPMMYRDM